MDDQEALEELLKHIVSIIHNLGGDPYGYLRESLENYVNAPDGPDVGDGPEGD